MSLTVGKYTFSAWLRRGIGRSIQEPDTLGFANGPDLERAAVPVEVQVNARPVKKSFALLGPGDVVGISRDNVVRTEPHDWVTDFEPNYLAFIEFYEEDFLWRYTPAAPVGAQLRPWLALVVLEEPTAESVGEYKRNDQPPPRVTITVNSTASLPPHKQTWAWAHVHTNEAFDQASDFEKFLESLETPDHPNADRITCRLTSPRKLKPNTAYAAFVVPAFETGRRAGLDPRADLKNVPAQQPAWTDAAGSVELPVLYEWRFRTGENEDFESMVKRLEPRTADARVGIRDMDGEKPGWGLTIGSDIGQIVPTDDKQTVLGLEGALKAPTTRSRPVAVDPTRAFLQQLASVLNLADQRRNNPATAALPVVTPPIYGEHHALKHTVDVAGAGWVDALNRDPRHRVPAGFGVRVVRENQESYVARAWTQVQKVLQANNLIRLAAYAMRASEAVYLNLAAKLAPEEKVTFFGAALRKVRGSPTTLQHLLQESTLPPAAIGGAMRRMLRPRGVLARRIAAVDPAFNHAALVRGLADGSLRAAPPKQPAADLATDQQVADRMPSLALPGWLAWLIRQRWLVLALLVLVLLLAAAGTGLWLACGALALLAVAGAVAADRWEWAHPAAAGIIPGIAAVTQPGVVAGVVDGTPARPDFRLVETDPVVPPVPAGGTQVTSDVERTSSGPAAVSFNTVSTFTPRAAGADSMEALAFRRAATALETRLAIAAPEQKREPFDLRNADLKLSAAVDPLKAFPRRVAAGVKFGFDQSWLLQPEHLVPAMAYPDFDDPMYEKLRDLSSELLLPNLQLIPPNSITLLETNPTFIEAYLTGLNFEFGKELLWREFPTDQRGSYFRKFWDRRGIMATPSDLPASELAERAKDITPLDTWPSASALGAHRNPKRPPGKQVVLTIRGDLLKKYPNTLIYAQKAHMAHDKSGAPLPHADPVVREVESEADIQNEIRFPDFKAAVDPDIRFFGFDLTVDQARGAATPRAEADEWGYYFIIQQLPGEPRFGMDVTFSPDDDPQTPLTWNDLAWTLFPAGQTFIDTTVRPQSFAPAGPGDSLDQWGSDSARMAAILFQEPVMIAVHAREILEGLE
jgi:hypothetical protein